MGVELHIPDNFCEFVEDVLVLQSPSVQKRFIVPYWNGVVLNIVLRPFIEFFAHIYEVGGNPAEQTATNIFVV